MGLTHLTERETITVSTMLGQMTHPVHWLLLTAENDPRSTLSSTLANEIQSLNPSRIRVSEVSSTTERTHLQDRYQIAREPAWILLDHRQKPAGVRFIGLPSGYQFATILNWMLDVSRRRVLVEPSSFRWCASQKQQVEIWVMVTSTCPHSPRVVSLAERMALANPKQIRTTVVEANAFLDWSEVQGITEVPTMRISIAHGPAPLYITGTVSERVLVQRLQQWQEAFASEALREEEQR